MVVLSSTLVAGAEKARYLDMATLSGKDAFFDIAKALAIARAFSSYIITQDERIKLLLLNLLRRKGVEAVDGELEQQLMQFVNREGFILKLQLPAPRAIIKEGLYEEAYRLALQALIAA